MPSLSVVIIAQDEERTIGEVLDAVAELADEIVLVDSGSTDRTKAIAQSRGARVMHHDWPGFAAQKNFAIGEARCEWILSLDADEILTPELVLEIKQVLSGNLHTEFDGFKIARLMLIGEQPLRFGGFYPDAQLRLFRAGRGRFNDRLVHESVQLDGRVSTLRNHLLHKAYRDESGFESAHEKYAKLAAQEAVRSGFRPWKASLTNEIFHPIWTFLYRYIGRIGFLDGMLGLRMNIKYAQYVRKKISYLRSHARDQAPGSAGDRR